MFNSKTKTALYLVHLTIIAALLSACSNSTPSEANAKSELEKGSVSDYKISYGLKNGTIRIDSFAKVNGQASEVNGIKMYATEYQAELVFLKDIPREPFCSEAFEGYCGGAKVGDKKTTKGEMKFQLTEKGWKGPSGAIY